MEKIKKFMQPLTKWGFIKQAMKIGMFFSVVFSSIQAYKIWSLFQKYPQKMYQYSLGIQPSELTTKIQLLQTGKNLVYLTLFFYLLFEICSAMELKNKHWLLGRLNKSKAFKKLKNWGDTLEDD